MHSPTPIYDFKAFHFLWIESNFFWAELALIFGSCQIAFDLLNSKNLRLIASLVMITFYGGLSVGILETAPLSLMWVAYFGWTLHNVFIVVRI
jgi:hypothetical protein